MGKFYILSQSFVPNSAITNHVLAYIRGFSDLGVQAEWVFLLPDNHCSEVQEDLPNIDVKYLWKRRFANNKYLKHLYKQYAYARFFFSLREGDTILVFGLSAYLYNLTKRKGIRVFQRRVEHPNAVDNSRYWFSSRHYYDACRMCDGIFVITHALKGYYESCQVDSHKIEVINMVVDSTRFNRINKNPNVEPYIAYCGNASNSKDGVDDLIKAFSMVAKQKDDVKLVIMGQAPAKESNNEQLVHRLGLESKVVFTGIIPATEMPQKLKDAKILALARPQSLQNTYGFPTKLGEYLLTGNPVVITRVGDIPLFLKDKETALMSDCHDIQAFADNLMWALNNYEEAQIIGERGKRVAEEHFDYLNETRKMVHFMFRDA